MVTLLAHGLNASDGTIHTLTQAICIAWVFSCLRSCERHVSYWTSPKK